MSVITIWWEKLENAILHGILPSEDNGYIHINIYRDNDMLMIVVSDNGEGMDKGIIHSFENFEEIARKAGKRRHIGISNIRDRIQYLYGAPYGMQIRQGKTKGTIVTICVPYAISTKNEIS